MMISRIRLIFILVFLGVSSVLAQSRNDLSYVTETNGEGYFTISSGNEISELLIDSSDDPGVIRAFYDLQTDNNNVTGKKPDLKLDKTFNSKNVIIAGTIGKSAIIDDLVARKLIDVKELDGKWEKFIIKTIDRPMPDVERALVIVGSDKRGAIYGIYDLAEQMGVSPWYWWADVPVKKKENVYVIPGTYTLGEPAV